MIVRTETKQILDTHAFLNFRLTPNTAFVNAQKDVIIFDKRFGNASVSMVGNTLVKKMSFANEEDLQRYLNAQAEISDKHMVIEAALSGILSTAIETITVE